MRFNVNDADRYGGQGGGGYFRLANDKDIAQVRFLYNSIEDVEGFAVHEIEIDGKKRYVNCLREYGDPMSVCPFCADGKYTQVKYFVPLYNLDTQRVETWERGKQFGQKLSSMCARYPKLVSKVFEIERNGKAGDQQTRYEIYPIDGDSAELSDFEVPSPLGTHVLDKTADEMTFYLQNNHFPSDTNSNNSTPEYVRRDNVRRTPSNTNRDERERF